MTAAASLWRGPHRARPAGPSIVCEAQPNTGGNIFRGKLTRNHLAALAAILTAIALYLGALVLFSDASFGASAPPGAEPSRPVAPACHTVTAKVFNRRVRILDKLTGKRHHKASRKVCKSHYRKLGAKVRKARADCLRRARRTEASVYWPGGDSGGMTGSCGWYLGNYRYGFAELGMGSYMGHLPCGTVVYVHGPNGRTVAAPKLDVGYGSGSSGRAIDLWNRTGPAVGIGNGIGQVTYSTRNCWIR